MESSPLRERAETLIRQGQAAAHAGQQELARRYLQAAVDINPDNPTAWLWLAGVQPPEEARASLLKVLELDPDNLRAKAGLAWVEQQLAAAPPPAPNLREKPDAPTVSTSETITPLNAPSSSTSEPAGTPSIGESANRTLSAEQALRAHLRETYPDTATPAATSGEEPAAGSRPRPERPAVTIPADVEQDRDPRARLYQILFALLVFLFLAGLLVLAAAIVGVI